MMTDKYMFYPESELHNVDFDTQQTNVGYRVMAHVDLYDCGEFEG